MMEALSYTFVQHAIIAGVLVSFAAGLVGSLVVVNRMVFLAGGIAHTAYGGIGLAVFFGLPIFAGASLFALGAAALIAYLTLHDRSRIDTIIGLVWAVGMAIGVIFVDLTPGYNVDLMSYLFGSILAVDGTDIVFMGGLLVVILALIMLRYRDILAVSYDREYAALRGINVATVYTAILVLTALTVVVAIKVVGLILVISLLTMPTFIAERLSHSLMGMMFLSGVLATLFTLCGLIASYAWNLTSGAAIILVSAISLGAFLVWDGRNKHSK